MHTRAEIQRAYAIPTSNLAVDCSKIHGEYAGREEGISESPQKILAAENSKPKRQTSAENLQDKRCDREILMLSRLEEEKI